MPRSWTGFIRRSLRVVGFLILGLLILVIGGLCALLVWVRTDGGRDFVRNKVLEVAHESVPGLALGRIGGDFTKTLVLEDIVSTGQRPKVEEHDGYLYIVLPMLSIDPGSGTVEDEQLSLVLGPNFVVMFQERPGDDFDPVRERAGAPGPLRLGGARHGEVDGGGVRGGEQTEDLVPPRRVAQLDDRVAISRDPAAGDARDRIDLARGRRPRGERGG